MTTRNNPAPVLEQKQIQEQTPHVTISQKELERYIGVKNQIEKLVSEKEVLEVELKNLLSSGATVEEGIHVARVEMSERRNVAWRTEFEALGDKLKGKGEGVKLAEKLLAETPPTTGIRLIVK